MTVAAERQPLAYERVEDVCEALRSAGHRVSAPARIVLDTLFEADGPVSAERIAHGDGDRRRALELTSVYRNLERLEQLGVVKHVHIGHGPGLYALARSGAREYLVCERCGRVTGVDPAALDDIRKTLRRAFGFHARFSHFPIHGHCADCKRALASNRADRQAPVQQREADAPNREQHDEHEQSHVHEHSHEGVTHGHFHSSHEHEHTEHDHQHSHGDRVHSHPHPHESGLEHDHRHQHDEGA